MNDCSNLESKTAFDLVRMAVRNHGISGEEIVAKVMSQYCDCYPATNRGAVAQITSDFLNGGPCPMVVACAITGLIADSMTATRQ